MERTSDAIVLPVHTWTSSSFYFLPVAPKALQTQFSTSEGCDSLWRLSSDISTSCSSDA